MSVTTTSVSPFLATEGSGGIVYAPTECTVAEAAKFLDGPEALIDELLDTGVIAFRMENGKPLVQWSSLLEFEQEERRINTALDEMVRMNQEMGLYDD